MIIKRQSPTSAVPKGGRVVLFLALCLWPTVSAADVPLFEKEPFDRITLDAANDNAVLDVFPLDLPGRKVPESPKPSAKLKMRLLNSPEKTYEVQWHNIEKLELFEQMILADAVELVGSGDLDEAYGYFLFLRENHAGMDGLDAAMQTYIYEEAKAAHMAGIFDRALAMLRELHEMNPKRPGLDKALGITTEKLIEEYVAAEDYYSARNLLGNLADWYPQEATVVKWRGKLKSQATALLSEAQKAEQSGDVPKASSLCRKLMQVYPELPDARQFAESLWRKYPHVVVGVTLPAVDFQPDRLDDWAARRAGRLVYRTLTEFSGPGSECGTYECPVGSIDVDQISGRITVQLRPGIRWSQGRATLTGHDLSRRLLAMADPAQPAYRADWAELLDGLAVHNVYRVDVDLRRVHVRPEALLQTALVPYTDPDLRQQSLLSNGPFVVHSQSETETVYRANRQYFAAVPTQPKEICERRYKRGADALRALSRGRIQVVDRVNPWDLDTARGDANLVVEPYAVPLVHCLIPNMRRPLGSNRTFRRALVYAINRSAILRQLVGGDLPEGCRQISGPFPIGISADDPIAYAYNEDVKPREYEPRLAVALATVALRELAAAEAKKGRKLERSPPLVLAHPPDELSRIACGSIAAYLTLVGLEVELRELTSGIPAAVPDDVDLMYAQLAVWEPLVDARRLLGEKGPGGGCSPYMSLALRELDSAKEFHPVLWRIHRLAHQDVAVVPLWQMTDHFAYRKSVSGVGSRPVTLYRNVERWQVPLEYPQE